MSSQICVKEASRHVPLTALAQLQPGGDLVPRAVTVAGIGDGIGEPCLRLGDEARQAGEDGAGIAMPRAPQAHEGLDRVFDQGERLVVDVGVQGPVAAGPVELEGSAGQPAGALRAGREALVTEPSARQAGRSVHHLET